MSAARSDVFDRGMYKTGNTALTNGSAGPKDNLFSAEGRIGVQSFCARYFVCLLAMVVCLVPLVVAAHGFHLDKPSMHCIGVFVVFGPLLMVPLYVMTVSAIKRLHDLNHSGWLLTLNAVPVVGIVWAMYSSFHRSKEDSVNKYGAMIPSSQFEAVLSKFGGFAIVGVTSFVVALLTQVVLLL